MLEWQASSLSWRLKIKGGTWLNEKFHVNYVGIYFYVYWFLPQIVVFVTLYWLLKKLYQRKYTGIITSQRTCQNVYVFFPQVINWLFIGHNRTWFSKHFFLNLGKKEHLKASCDPSLVVMKLKKNNKTVPHNWEDNPTAYYWYCWNC